MNAAFQLWRVAAPLPVHEDGGAVAAEIAAVAGGLRRDVRSRLADVASRSITRSGASADAWTAARDRYRPQALAAKNEVDLETAIDEMVAAQPLIKPVVTSSGAVVVSGHPLASEAGRLAFEKGGNVVDAMIAVSFALGVVEPEASGVGGDGAAVLYLKGMKKPTVIDYKDMTPIKATPDNPKMMRDGRMVGDGPAAANIPGVVAGLDYLYRHYASGKVKWEDLVAPAIALADEGFILDEGLPSSIAEGRRFLEKWPEAAKIYLPGGKVPKPGDRFFNKDYANTLRSIQKGGADAFYRGDIAKKIAADMEENGGIITFADLAQYRAIERAPDRRPLPRPLVVCGRASGLDRHPAVRVAARARELPAETGRARVDRRRLSALSRRVVEGARSAAPRRRSRALAGGLRGASDHRARDEAVREDRRRGRRRATSASRPMTHR